MKRFQPFVLAVVSTMLAIGLTFLVLRANRLPIRRGSMPAQEEAAE